MFVLFLFVCGKVQGVSNVFDSLIRSEMLKNYSPSKNTGVGFHFLLQCMKVKSESEVTQSCPTLSDLIDCSLPGSSVRGIFQARVLKWVATALLINANKYERGSKQ